MKVLITGAKGFIGKNLIATLSHLNYEILPVDIDTSEDELISYTKEAEAVIHLAGVNRPLKAEEFYSGNANFTFKLCDLLKSSHNKCPVIFTSSIKAECKNDYGTSKKMAEDLLVFFAKTEGNPLYLYRLSNVFGKWCRPNYNSVVATFAYNVTHDLPLRVDDENVEIPFVYIDDIVAEFVRVLSRQVAPTEEILEVTPIYNVRLKRLIDLLQKFKMSRSTLVVPNVSDGFEAKLYATYLSYIEPDDYAYELHMNIDQRGSFSEFVRTEQAGQFSINVAHPGIVKGNHWHHTKNEKFLVVSGHGLIKMRKIDEDKIYTYEVSGAKLVVVDIPVGYTHTIANIGDNDLVTVMWASEPFNKDKPDTYFLEVEPCKN